MIFFSKDYLTQKVLLQIESIIYFLGMAGVSYWVVTKALGKKGGSFKWTKNLPLLLTLFLVVQTVLSSAISGFVQRMPPSQIEGVIFLVIVFSWHFYIIAAFEKKKRLKAILSGLVTHSFIYVPVWLICFCFMNLLQK